MSFKRNQVEEAVSRILQPRSPGPTSELRTRLKRLLDTDRERRRNLRSADPELAQYAFYSDDPPGTGVEIWFSEYEAFALLIGLRLMDHGWPQGFAVSVMRRTRPDLETEHVRILKLDPKVLFDEERIRRKAKEGDMALDNTDPVFLTIASKPRTAPSDEGEPLACAVRRGQRDALKFASNAVAGSGAFTMFEVATSARKLLDELMRTEPRRRGRGA